MEYYDMNMIDARKAFFVIGSDIYGPMGNELIPLATEEDARNLLKDHKGKRFSDLRRSPLGDRAIGLMASGAGGKSDEHWFVEGDSNGSKIECIPSRSVGSTAGFYGASPDPSSTPKG